MNYYALRLGPLIMDSHVAERWAVSSILHDTVLWYPRFFRFDSKQHGFFSPLDYNEFDILNAFGIDEMSMDKLHECFTGDQLIMAHDSMTVIELRRLFGLRQS